MESGLHQPSVPVQAEIPCGSRLSASRKCHKTDDHGSITGPPLKGSPSNGSVSSMLLEMLPHAALTEGT